MAASDLMPLHDGAADVLISGQVLEHCEEFWRLFPEMARVLAPDGFMIVIAPSAGPIHRFPVDCYRFYPDSFRTLARIASLNLIELFHDDRGPWNDLVGVFRHHGAPEYSPATGARVLLQEPGAVAKHVLDQSPEVNVVRPAR